jgi:hypothetical protein
VAEVGGVTVQGDKVQTAGVEFLELDVQRGLDPLLGAAVVAFALQPGWLQTSDEPRLRIAAPSTSVQSMHKARGEG